MDLQRCENNAVEEGTDPECCLATKTRFGTITARRCTPAAIAAAGGGSCGALVRHCEGITVVDAASLRRCLRCAHTQALDCLLATIYGISSPATLDCFGSRLRARPPGATHHGIAHVAGG